MTTEQAAVAVAILNSYAHGYLGLEMYQAMVAGAVKEDGAVLIVGCKDGAEIAEDFHHALAMIDAIYEKAQN